MHPDSPSAHRRAGDRAPDAANPSPGPGQPGRSVQATTGASSNAQGLLPVPAHCEHVAVYLKRRPADPYLGSIKEGRFFFRSGYGDLLDTPAIDDQRPVDVVEIERWHPLRRRADLNANGLPVLGDRRARMRQRGDDR